MKLGHRLMSETFGEYLRRNRDDLKLTQKELADKAGISQSYVSGLERGVNKEPDRDYVIALARALEVPAADALTIAGLSAEGEKADQKPASAMAQYEVVKMLIDGQEVKRYQYPGFEVEGKMVWMVAEEPRTEDEVEKMRFALRIVFSRES